MRVLISLTMAAIMLAAPLSARSATDAPAEQRFDLEVVDVPARAFFLGLATRGGVNVLVHPKVNGTLTLGLRGVTVSETLEAVRDLYGYDYRRTAGGYFVLPATVRTKFFVVNYLDMSRSGTSRTSVSSGSITDSRRNGGDGSGAAVGSPTGESTTIAEQSVTTTGTAIVTHSDSDFWAQLEANIKSIVGAEADRSVVVNRHSGVIAVKADNEELRSVGDYLGRIQSTVTRQVVLEAKILEVELNDDFQAGINWAAILQRGPDTYFGGLASPPGAFNGNPLDTPGRTATVAPGNPISGFTNTTLGSAFTLAMDFRDVNVLVDLLQAQGNTRVLSSPRVATLHNQKAVIKAGTDELFVTNVSSNTVTGTATATSREVELTPFFSGIALDVTPQIGEDDEVILHIHPSVSEVRDQTKRLTIDGRTDELPLAVSEIRESDSVVRARSGQVVVIGGLMRSSRGDQDFGVPFLGSIPGIGNLFKSRRKTDHKTELVILLKPLVVGRDEAAALTAEAAARLQQAEAQLR